MSSTIKQAIEALKSRVADAYTAIVAKGGTLPATQDSANLPSAIANIPSGGGSPYDDLSQLGFTQSQIDELTAIATPTAEDIAASSQYMGRSGGIGRAWQGNQFWTLKYIPLYIATGAGDITGYLYTTYCCEICAGIQYADNSVISTGENFCQNVNTLRYFGGDLLRFSSSMYYAFNGCPSLERIPKIILPTTISNASRAFQNMFRNCKMLQVIDFANSDISQAAGSWDRVFEGCLRLKEIKGVLDVGASTYFYAVFDNCISLETVWLKNIGINGMDLSTCTKLSYDSLLYMVQNLKNVSGFRLTIGTTNKNKLNATAEGQAAIAAAQAMGWTIA